MSGAPYAKKDNKQKRGMDEYLTYRHAEKSSAEAA